MKKLLLVLIVLGLSAPPPLLSWKNGAQSISSPLFGTHAYIAFKGYISAGPSHLTWVKNNLNAYFLGTEAPDLGSKLPEAEGTYHDTGPVSLHPL